MTSYLRNGALAVFYALLVVASVNLVQGDVVRRCQTLYSATGVTATGNSTIYTLEKTSLDERAWTARAEATNNSGTTPTLDVKIQSCRKANDTTSCSDTPFAFDQCTTGACYGGDGIQNIDLNPDQANIFPYLRVVRTLGGTNPNYDLTVYLCSP